MNTRVAPRPPTDRPPLSLTPSTVGYPGNGNFSSTNLNSPSVRTNSGFSNATTSYSPASSRTNLSDPLQAAAPVLQALVKYKEDGFGSMFWKSKHAVLRQHTIDFLKTEGGKTAFTIYLGHVTGIQRWDAIPLCIELVRAANPAGYPGVPLREQPQRTMYIKFEGDEALYEWQDGIYSRCPAISGVSNPTNFNHKVHVGFDPSTGGFLGLPPEWERLLNSSAITKDDYLKNPRAVIEVLEFYTDISKRAGQPDQYPSLTPTPPAYSNQNMQLGHGGGGTSIAPPRPMPPGNGERTASFSSQQQPRYANTPPRSQGPAQPQGQRDISGSNGYGNYGSQQPQNGSDSKLNMGGDMRRLMEEEARKVKEQQERDQRQRARDEEDRREQEAYNASIPQTRTPMAKQELGGYGGGSVDQSRYNPIRAAPSAPTDRSRQQARPQVARQNTSESPSGAAITPPRAPYAQNGSASRDQSPSDSSLRTQLRADQQAPRQPSSATRQPPSANDRSNDGQERRPTQGSANTQSSRLPAPVQTPKPLNVSKTTNGQTTQQVPKPAGNPPAAKPETRQKEARMSAMSETEVMAKLKKIVTRLDPLDSYLKQKKIGQGASGSVYIAKVRSDATSGVAKGLFRRDGTDSRVAIKTMDLRQQPRKELIVNEIIVMKESSHPNIVNYLDSFLIENDSELWVIMEYMNGGALTDVIENNSNISEDQIAAICNEVSILTAKKRCILTDWLLDMQRTCPSSWAGYHPSRYQERQRAPRLGWTCQD